ncbi:hypothetical protein [Flavihumibacter solisilvae]|uniref:Uncharacterized protein n=1 Tax=Flavihumibacter solisilvae TaxID=1349421 RepID=A0A0C1J0T8_9BACT|nr:hypothetical protein [Flavihumibacter solisilvae]KIC96389.1 hypothetical protein OI18_01160 [Flavihumibacter solisilvae]
MSTLNFRLFLTTVFFTCSYSLTIAGTASPGKPFRLCKTVISLRALTDTVPAPNPPAVVQPEDNKEKKDIIKEVPKSRRQSKPVIVTPRVKTPPLKIIKPKIIRRTGIL